MANITAGMVKELRDTTGAGMMDCKAALKETDGDMEAAVDWLRTKGLAKAAKTAGRVAADGLVAVAVDGPKGVVVEVNSETDFVARNENFQKMVSAIADVALKTDGDTDALKAADFPGAGKSVEAHISEMVGTIGENMTLRRAESLSVDNGAVAAYVHNQTAPGLGKIGVLVALESTGDAGKLAELGRQIAMHVAATNPLAATEAELDPAVVDKERDVLSAEARESGKPEEIIAKMVEGRLRKYYEEVCLLEQTYVIDGETKVAKVLEQAAKDLGSEIAVTGMVRYMLGEGIERAESDFAAEVAAQLS